MVHNSVQCVYHTHIYPHIHPHAHTHTHSQIDVYFRKTKTTLTRSASLRREKNPYTEYNSIVKRMSLFSSWEKKRPIDSDRVEEGGGEGEIKKTRKAKDKYMCCVFPLTMTDDKMLTISRKMKTIKSHSKWCQAKVVLGLVQSLHSVALRCLQKWQRMGKNRKETQHKKTENGLNLNMNVIIISIPFFSRHDVVAVCLYQLCRVCVG